MSKCFELAIGQHAFTYELTVSSFKFVVQGNRHKAAHRIVGLN